MTGRPRKSASDTLWSGVQGSANSGASLPGAMGVERWSTLVCVKSWLPSLAKTLVRVRMARTGPSSRVRNSGLSPALADEPCAPATGDEAESPARDDQQPVLEADQIEEMHDEPGDPGDEAADADPLDVRDGLRATDRGQIALVDVLEGLRGAARQTIADHPRDVAAFLDRNRSEAGKCHVRAVAFDNAHHVADREDIGMVVERQILFHGDTPNAVDLRPVRRGQLRGERRRGDACSPDDRARRNSFDLAALGANRYRDGADVDHRVS